MHYREEFDMRVFEHLPYIFEVFTLNKTYVLRNDIRRWGEIRELEFITEEFKNETDKRWFEFIEQHNGKIIENTIEREFNDRYQEYLKSKLM